MHMKHPVPGTPQAELCALRHFVIKLLQGRLQRYHTMYHPSTRATTRVVWIVTAPLGLGFMRPLSEIHASEGGRASTAAFRRGKGSLLGLMCSQSLAWDGTTYIAQAAASSDPDTQIYCCCTAGACVV